MRLFSNSISFLVIFMKQLVRDMSSLHFVYTVHVAFFRAETKKIKARFNVTSKMKRKAFKIFEVRA